MKNLLFLKSRWDKCFFYPWQFQFVFQIQLSGFEIIWKITILKNSDSDSKTVIVRIGFSKGFSTPKFSFRILNSARINLVANLLSQLEKIERQNYLDLPDSELGLSLLVLRRRISKIFIFSNLSRRSEFSSTPLGRRYVIGWFYWVPFINSSPVRVAGFSRVSLAFD